MNESERTALGDFQTPPALAAKVVALLRAEGLSPGTVLEPTCGLGAFVAAALAGFPGASVVACDSNPDYVRATARLSAQLSSPARLSCTAANFFTHDWTATLASLPEPILVVGNPPWVTVSELGALRSSHVPEKSNYQRRRGLDAVTGTSNFDVAEWMILKLLDAAQARRVILAMLIKTSVARRVLTHLWAGGIPVARARMLRFDARVHFGARADACLFHCELGGGESFECDIADLDRPAVPRGRIGWRHERLVADPAAYDRQQTLLRPAGESGKMRWRSGVKHDCSAVMELRREGGGEGRLVNGYAETADLEPDYVYPLLKGTDLANGRVGGVRRWLLVTQARPGDDTAVIAQRAPKTWAYLGRHGGQLDARRSAIYRNRPRFSLFGVGPYTFAPWKVAISALHKRLLFTPIGPIDDRPVVLDDTCYHLSFESAVDAQFVAALLNDECSRELLGSLIFWDAKRPITSDILQRLDLRQVAIRLNLASELERCLSGLREPPTGPRGRGAARQC